MILSTLAMLSLCKGTTLGFNCDNIDVMGPMHESMNVTVIYDIQRAKCKHEFVNGVDTWRVAMGYKINGVVQKPERIAWIEPAGYPLVVNTPTLYDVPEGTLEFWFTCSNAHQTEYDSNYGKNFKFYINKIPTIVFKSDETETVENGPIVRDGSVKVDYELARAKCSPDDGPWSVMLYYSMNTPYGFQTISEELVKFEPNTPVVINKPIIKCLPKSDLTVWFACSSPNASPDFGHGKQYVFPIQ